MDNVGLVLEGGGMRGVYTAGILDFFMEKELYFPYVIGVSAGACMAASYISKQLGRNKIINIDYVEDPRYLNWRNFLRERSLFGMNFIFDELPNKLEPFDFDTYQQSKQHYVVGTTDCISGEPVYFRNDSEVDILLALRASSSLPFLSPAVFIDGHPYFDGGISDPIPIHQSIKDGNEKNIVVLTRNSGYRKKPFKNKWIAKRFYPKYPGLIQAMSTRHEVYNRSLDDLEEMEKKQTAFIFRPSEPLQVDRVEKNPQKLEDLFRLGIRDAERNYDRLCEWLQK